jgi:hypothetical protein
MVRRRAVAPLAVEPAQNANSTEYNTETGGIRKVRGDQGTGAAFARHGTAPYAAALPSHPPLASGKAGC